MRNKKETRYCYSEKERDKALAEIRGPEITRFKGLGEISPKEFGQFIGERMRLVPITAKNMGEVPAAVVLDFFMGKNTPERKEFIIEHLIETVL